MSISFGVAGKRTEGDPRVLGRSNEIMTIKGNCKTQTTVWMRGLDARLSWCYFGILSLADTTAALKARGLWETRLIGIPNRRQAWKVQSRVWENGSTSKELAEQAWGHEFRPQLPREIPGMWLTSVTSMLTMALPILIDGADEFPAFSSRLKVTGGRLEEREDFIVPLGPVKGMSGLTGLIFVFVVGVAVPRT